MVGCTQKILLGGGQETLFLIGQPAEETVAEAAEGMVKACIFTKSPKLNVATAHSI